MTNLYQYCESCKTETNFNPEKVTCKKCGTKSKNYGKKTDL